MRRDWDDHARMSIAALRWAFPLKMRDPSAKAVLVALADHADADGTCWPSIRRLTQFTSLGERTVQRALKRLADEGRIVVRQRHGQSCLITLRVDDTPSRRRPSPVTATPTPVTVTPEPSITATEPSRDDHERCTDSQGTRLPADWRPAPAERHYARERGLDPDLVAEEFRNYWCALPGAKGRKLDWAATFRNRCIERAGAHRPGARQGGRAQGPAGLVAAAGRVLRRRGLDVT